MGLKIDLYTAIALAIENNKDLKVKLFETALADRKVEEVKYTETKEVKPNIKVTPKRAPKSKDEITESHT